MVYLLFDKPVEVPDDPLDGDEAGEDAVEAVADESPPGMTEEAVAFGSAAAAEAESTESEGAVAPVAAGIS